MSIVLDGARVWIPRSCDPIYAVRISLDYRALGIVERDEIVWFWIGPHEEYEKLLS